MRHIIGDSRQQATLLPDTVDDYVDEDHPVWVIDAFVDSLDMKALGFSKAETQITGHKLYDADQECYICPAGERLSYKTVNRKEKRRMFTRDGCHSCTLKSQCTKSKQRWVSRHFHEDAFERCDTRLKKKLALMQLRVAIVERPFAILKQIGRIELQLETYYKSRGGSCAAGCIEIAESHARKNLSSETQNPRSFERGS